MTYHIKTFGCQMNVSDSERISAFLEQRGYLSTEKIQDATLTIFNTCGIKQTAENRAYSMINNIRKEKNQAVKIIMTGCLANRADVQKRMRTKVDLFCEIKNFEKEFTKLVAIQQKPTSKSHHDIISNRDYLSIIPKYTNNFQAYVPIMTGCNNFCTYCVVPYARGREVSRSAEEIITEVKDLVSRGYKSITLLGQNVNSYHGTWHMKYETKNSKKQPSTNYALLANDYVNFSTLLKKINAVPGKFWISFVSAHPKDMSNDLIETVAKCKKICEWIHLPVQAGNNDVLKRMNRRYTQEHYLKLIKKIRSEFKKHKPEIPFSISSDIIVGFPGETKTQFSDSEKIMQKAKYDIVFFGQFSPRPGTLAWDMKDNISHEEKSRRENALNEILKKTALANNKKYLGKKLEVLIEKEKAGFYYGKTRTMKNIKVPNTKKDLIGKFAKVKITKANVWNLEADFNITSDIK